MGWLSDRLQKIRLRANYRLYKSIIYIYIVGIQHVTRSLESYSQSYNTIPHKYITPNNDVTG